MTAFVLRRAFAISVSFESQLLKNVVLVMVPVEASEKTLPTPLLGSGLQSCFLWSFGLIFSLIS